MAEMVHLFPWRGPWIVVACSPIPAACYLSWHVPALQVQVHNRNQLQTRSPSVDRGLLWRAAEVGVGQRRNRKMSIERLQWPRACRWVFTSISTVRFLPNQ